MSETAKRSAVYEDLFEIPSNMIGEIVDGELTTTPRPAGRHILATSSLGGELFGPFQKGLGGPGGWWILIEPELNISEQVMVPDVAGWKKDRMSSVPDDQRFTVVPDWVCEVLSSGTARFDRTSKMPKYAALHVPYLWLIDPLQRTLEVFELVSERWTLVQTASEDQRVRAEPFAALELELGSLWGE
jgi:Uma2 family endonuclease